jgi:hypothetical protein
MEVNPRRAVFDDPVRKNVNLMFLREARGQLRNVTAVPAGAMVIVHDEGDLHPPPVHLRVGKLRLKIRRTRPVFLV